MVCMWFVCGNFDVSPKIVCEGFCEFVSDIVNE